ncbi:MAG TPA: GNAT family N-acetyltransferase [Chloroflexia bacterium]|nr:GNAT family N-acetyltransferase [Chloroflexia bacterium]
MERRQDGFVVSDDPALVDLDVVHGYLVRSYWSEGIPRYIVERAVANSMCFGVYEEGSGRQVGFARVVTDRATFAWLADVFVLEEYRGRGLSKLLMATIMDHPDLQTLRRFTLATKDAHGLYAQFGFTPLDNPDRFMVRRNSAVHRDGRYVLPDAEE